ncbi:MAG: hypothetical protein WAO50_10640 [Candidatus Nanopelagicales bacterium]
MHLTRERPSATRSADVPAGQEGRAARQSRARLSDARVWGGATLLVLSALAGALLLGRSGDEVAVLQATRDLSIGSVPVDLQPVLVPRAIADSYVAADSIVDGQVRWPISAGELLPRGVLANAAPTPTRGVTLALDPGRTPAGLLAGDLVDVWVTSDSPEALGGRSASVRVLEKATVTAVEASSFGGGLSVELAVPLEQVNDVIEAMRTGAIDMVTVPLADQSIAP